MREFFESLVEYLKDVIEEIFKILAYAVATAGVYCVLFYGSRYMWEVFIHTYTGELSKESNPERFQQMSEVMALQPYWQTSLELAGVSAVFMMAVALISQFIYLRHLLYDSLWGVLKLAWAIVLSFGLAWLIQHVDHGIETGITNAQTYVFLFLPGISCMLFVCMQSARRILPDIGTMVVAIVSRIG